MKRHFTIVFFFHRGRAGTEAVTSLLCLVRIPGNPAVNCVDLLSTS